MEHQSSSHDAARATGNRSDAGQATGNEPRPDQAQPGDSRPRRSILERAHKSVGPQTEADPGAPRSGSA